MPSDDALDELIEQITIDAYGDEGYWSFLQAFEDTVRFPLQATLAELRVVVTAIDFDGDERRGLVAVIERGDRSQAVSVLDINSIAEDHPTAGNEAALLLAAYRRWLGMS